VRVLTPATIRSPSPTAFARRLRGRRVTAVDRRGKYLLIRLSDNLVLVAHLRMTGDFEVAARREELHPSTRVIFAVGRHEVRFVDPRRLGHMDLVPRADLERFPGLRTLGIEPLSKEFTAGRLRRLLSGRRGGIKSALLRQDLVAGIGNIYADEILWQTRLHPGRSVASLSAQELRRLHRHIRGVLSRATRSLSRYGEPVGDLLEARERGGHCPRCGRELTVETIAGRTTYYCSHCQRTLRHPKGSLRGAKRRSNPSSEIASLRSQ
jgi:formamidopyrimidine-DNA glycosylase